MTGPTPSCLALWLAMPMPATAIMLITIQVIMIGTDERATQMVPASSCRWVGGWVGGGRSGSWFVCEGDRRTKSPQDRTNQNRACRLAGRRGTILVQRRARTECLLMAVVAQRRLAAAKGMRSCTLVTKQT